MDEIQISEKTEKIKRNLLFTSIFCGLAMWFEVDPSQANIWGIEAAEKRLTTGTVILIAWLLALYHAANLSLSLRADFADFHAKLQAQFREVCVRYILGVALDSFSRKELVLLSHHQPSTPPEQDPGRRVPWPALPEQFWNLGYDAKKNAAGAVMSIEGRKFTWFHSVRASMRQAFRKDQSKEPNAAPHQMLWLMDIFLPYSVFLLTTACAWWFLFGEPLRDAWYFATL